MLEIENNSVSNFFSIDKINEDMIIFESNIYQQNLNENTVF